MGERAKIAVIGDGGWGTTLAALLARKGFGVALWGIFPEYVAEMRSRRENVKFLPGIAIPEKVEVTSSLQDALRGAGTVVLATPSQFMRGVLGMLKMYDLSGKFFISVAKGIEQKTLLPMSAVIREVLGERPLSVMSGPTIALEVANGAPASVVVASREPGAAALAQELFMTERFRVYTGDDVTGVELGGSVKNVIAIASGACDAMGFGTNAKAALLTRGLTEIARLGMAMGGARDTFYGLSGLGDLATTCMSPYSRNRWLGEEIGKGKPLAAILKETTMVVEGVATAQSTHDLAVKHRVEMPITFEIYRVLYQGKDPKQAVRDLMTRAPKAERDL